MAVPSGNTRTDRFLGRFSRITTPGRTLIPQIDGMRFVAIGVVVVVHAMSTVYKLTGGAGRYPLPPEQDAVWWLGQEGVWGVSLFFVISGFILALPFAGRRLGTAEGAPKPPLASYYLRRLTRLEPPYLVALTLALGGVVLLGGTGASGQLPHYVVGAGYLHGIVFGTLNPVFLVGWSLEVEVQFYLVVPLLTVVFSIADDRWRRGAIVAVGLSGVVLGLAFRPLPAWVALSLPAHIQYFMAGFLLADLYLASWKMALPAGRHVWDVVAFGAIPVFVWLAYGPAHASLALGPLAASREMWRLICFPVLAFVFILGALRGSLWSRWLANRWVYTIGGMCYSIYLTHTLVIDLARKITLSAVVGNHLGATLVLQAILVTPFVLVAGGVFFVLVERPCMDPRWPRRVAALVRRSFGTRE